VLIGGSVLAWSSWKLNSIDRVDVALHAATTEQAQNFLIVGSDTRSLADKSSPDAAAIYGDGKDVPPGGQRADTIVIARVDPKASSVELLSIPRDLWVRKAGSQQKGRINAAYNGGAQELIDTVQQDLGIPINHYVEVNFDGFKGLVQAIGGVPMYFDRAMYDENTGLRIKKAGCYNLDPVQALAFARSRHLYYSNGKKWIADPTGDEGRITRQQIFLRRSMAKVATLGIADVNTLRKLIDVGIGAVKLDSSLTVDDMVSLARKYSSFDAASMVTHRLPTTGYRTDGGADVLLLDEVAARPVIDVFKGVATGSGSRATTTTVPVPGADAATLTVDVLNASGKPGVARTVSADLGALGFGVGTVSNAPVTQVNTIRHAKGDATAAQLLSSQFSQAPTLVVDTSLRSGHVTVIIGTGSLKVNAATTTTSSPPTSLKPGVTTTTTPESDKTVGFVTGDPPPGVRCGA